MLGFRLFRAVLFSLTLNALFGTVLLVVALVPVPGSTVRRLRGDLLVACPVLIVARCIFGLYVGSNKITNG